MKLPKTCIRHACDIGLVSHSVKMICYLSRIGGIYLQMQELNDIALLRQYVEQNSEEAFAALVSRHVNKVYSVALRHTRNPHQAEEITQAVFVILANKSRHLGKALSSQAGSIKPRG